MSLTAGTVLQNGKYVIRAVLEQNDFGITYEATQVYLDQAVILQTLSETPAEATKAAKIQQQFLDGVRNLAKRRHAYPGKVLDYFVESHQPFVTLEKVEGKLPPSVKDWLPVLEPKSVATDVAPAPVDAAQPATLSDTAVGELAIASGSPVEAMPDKATAPVQPVDYPPNGKDALPVSALDSPLNEPMDLPKPPPAPLPPTVKPADLDVHADVAAAVAASQNGSNGSNGSTGQGQLAIAPTVNHGTTQPAAGTRPNVSVKVLSQSKRKSKAWLPLSLVMTSVIAGVAGASFGWSLRFHKPGTSGNSNIPLLSNEQGFPSQNGWPVQESPEPVPVEPVWERPIPNNNPIRHTPIDYAPAPAEPIQSDKAAQPEDIIPKVSPIPDGSDAAPSDVAPLPAPIPDSSMPVPEPSSNPKSDTTPQPPAALPAPVPEPSAVAPAPEPSPIKSVDVTVQ